MLRIFKKSKDSSAKLNSAESDEAILLNDSSRSQFFPAELISSEEGLLILCTRGIHAFLLLEYVIKNEDAEGFSRAFQRLDFGPRNMAHVMIGRGNLRLTKATDADGEILSKDIKVGPHWKVSVSTVVDLFDSIYAGYKNGELNLLYSLPGDSSQCSFPKSTSSQVNNCLTFSRNFLLKYSVDLGLKKEDLDCIDGCEKWIPAQSPIPIVLHYKNKQEHRIDI